MTEWPANFEFKGKSLPYNRIQYNNPSERAVEVSIAFDFLVNLPKQTRVLEVGNVLSNYENVLSNHLGVHTRRIVDKFESEVGVDPLDLMDLPEAEKYEAILCVSTVEHIGQGIDPHGVYGEDAGVQRDLEAPLKAIAKIYALLAPQGKALVTVPFGRFIDGEWFIQFDQSYLDLLTQKYQIPASAMTTTFFRKVSMELGVEKARQLWVEASAQEVAQAEYNSPYSYANAIAILEFTKQHPYSLDQLSLSGVEPPPPAPAAPTSPEVLPAHDFTVVVDGVFFQLFDTSIAKVWRSLLSAWAANGFAHHVVVLDRINTAPKIPGIRYRLTPAYDYANPAQDRQILQQICDLEQADVFISSYYTTPLSTPSLFMAYDMIPEITGADLENPLWQAKHYAITRAAAYLCISHNTAKELCDLFSDIPSARVTVAQCGVSPEFFPAPPEAIALFKRKYSISKPYFLLADPGADYKNSILFFQGLSQLASKQGFEIVCTGNPVYVETSLRRFTTDPLILVAQLDDAELRAAYSGALALVFPSRCEGFGLPILEAFACGCPVITCPNSVIPEVAGTAAFYVLDGDTEVMANALCEVQKLPIRQSLIAAGLERAREFSWERMAEEVQQALVQTTLLELQLNPINLILAPDWSQTEADLGAQLATVLQAIATHPAQDQITLLLTQGNLTEEEASLILTGVTMTLLLEADLDVSAGPILSLVPTLSSLQWQALRAQIQARLVLDLEDREAIAAFDLASLPSYPVTTWINQVQVTQA